MIRAYLIDYPKLVDSLLQPERGPLGSFRSRIDLVYCLGLIGTSTYHPFLSAGLPGRGTSDAPVLVRHRKQFLFGCSVSSPVRYRSRACGPSLRRKWTRKGARNSASSGRGVLGACGTRGGFIPLLRTEIGPGFN